MDVGGAPPDGMDGAPGAIQRQDQLEGQALATQAVHRVRKGRLGVTFEALEHVGECGPGAGAKVEKYGKAARTAFLAIGVVPGITAVRGRRQHLASGLGLLGGAPVRPFRHRPPAALPPGKRQGGHSQPESTERRGGKRLHHRTNTAAAPKELKTSKATAECYAFRGGLRSTGAADFPYLR